MRDMMDKQDIEQRRRAARRTAWKLAIVALVIFGVFFMTGITGR
jgi:hypothetical protein